MILGLWECVLEATGLTVRGKCVTSGLIVVVSVASLDAETEISDELEAEDVCAKTENDDDNVTFSAVDDVDTLWVDARGGE